MEKYLFGIGIAFSLLSIFLFGSEYGQFMKIKEMKQANQTCWETHAVLFETDGSEIEFRCYEVNKNETTHNN